MNKKQILLDGKIISYYECLNGEKDGVLVFLHGWMQNGMSFEQTFKALEKANIPYISIDLPGFGSSKLIHDNMTIEEYGDCIISFIEKLNLKKIILVGHSFGGRISIYLGSFYKNISKIILIGAAGIVTPMNPLRLTVVKTGKVLFSFPGLRKFQQKIKGAAGSSDYSSSGRMEKIFRNAISNDLRKYMQQIPFPTMMIWGKDDDQVPVHEAEIMHTYIQASVLHLLEGGHFIHQEKTKETSDLILDFIKK